MFSNLFITLDYLELWQAFLDTLLMLALSSLISALIGIPLGFLLYLTNKNNLLENVILHKILSYVINILRSIPFIVLIILIMPFTTFILGSAIGVKGVMPALIVGAFPFFARLVEGALNDVDRGLVYMAQSFGATNWQIIFKVLFREIIPNLISIFTVTIIALVAYSAMAGVVGGGGLGDLAIRYGYQRFQIDVMAVTVIILILLVQVLQYLGDLFLKFYKDKFGV